MTKPQLGGGNKSTLPTVIIRPGKYKPVKFQMEMPDEKQSGIYGLKSQVNEDDMVESMSLEDSVPKRSLNNGGNGIASSSGIGVKINVQPKLIGPNVMR